MTSIVRKENPNAFELPGKPGCLHVEFFESADRQRPVLEYVDGYVGVTVMSNQPSWGAAPVAGEAALLALTVGLLDACKHYGIEVPR